MQPKELARRLKGNDGPVVLDVRMGIEYRGGHIPGALYAPTLRILTRRAGLPKDRQTPLVVTCEHGPRAKLACKVLGWLGYRQVELLDGHMAGWRRAGLPLEKS